MHNSTSLPTKEKWAFGLAGLGQNMVYNYATAYIMVFYTDVMKLLPVAVGTLLLIARFFDAVNDPLMGHFVDRHSFKKGKLLPYLRWIPVPMFVSTVILFIVPFDNLTYRLIYAYITYILWDLVYTLSDIPYWGLSVLLSPHANDRLSLVTYARVLSNVGLAISIVLPPLLISNLGSQASAYFITGLLMAGIGSSLFTLVGFFTQERIQPSPSIEKVSWLHLFKNKPLMILQSSRVLSAFRMVIATAGLYYAKYNLGDEAQFSLLGGILIASMILAMFITPYLRKYFTKKALYGFSLVLGFFAHILMYFLGMDHFILTLGLLFVSGLSLGLGDVITYTLVGDTVEDYAQKTGIRLEGLIFASHTFTTKLQSAIGLFTIGLVLDQSGFVENSLQSLKASQGIFQLISLFPAIACLLSLIPLPFFHMEEH